MRGLFLCSLERGIYFANFAAILKINLITDNLAFIRYYEIP